MFQGAELFEAFKPFQGGGFHFGKPEEESPAEAIDADMFKDALKSERFARRGFGQMQERNGSP